MTKIDEAQEILKSLGLPKAQQNEISGITLLALAGIGEKDKWADAKQARVRIHDIITFAEQMYKKKYAENTRETIRRQVIHQLEQARVVDRNPDEPDLATNSPKTNYVLTDEVLSVVKSYGTKYWKRKIEEFGEKQQALLEVYRKRREMKQVPVRFSSGELVRLSPGKHNELQARVIEEFAPRFAPDSIVLYLGDTAKKVVRLEEGLFSDLGIPISEHDKLPDIVLYNKENNRLFLIEAVTSHGPVSPKRLFELEKMLRGCKAERIYISAFPDFSEFRSHMTDIAWETEVWLSEVPDHLIHFNGEKYLKS
ncbi:MAG: BsuBI/PstI family type II restriction endonuclease [Acidithiobacillus ferrivorans]